MPAAVVAGDQIRAVCGTHQIPGPPVGNPIVSPPLPFSAPLTNGLATKVTIQGRPMAVMGSSGLNLPPHVALHVSDPFLAPNLQEGRVVAGSSKVMVEGKPAAYSGCSTTVCFGMPGQLQGSAMTVSVAP